MAEIREKARWVDEVYRIQKTDPILGGEDGVINVQPTQITNRTAFLKQSAEAEHTEGGRHQVTNDMVADDAAIDEGKLLFEVPLKTVSSALEGAQDEISALQKEVVDVIGDDGILIHGLTKTVLLDWKYADFGFEFEMWTGDLIMRDIENRTVTCAVADDDSIDVTDPSGLRQGMRLLISDGINAEEVEIRELLDKGRIILKNLLKNTYRTPATLGYTDWEISEGLGTGAPGGVYYSKITTVLEQSPRGTLVIRRDTGSGELTVEYRDGRISGAWKKAEISKVSMTADEAWFDEYYLVDGGFTQLRVTVRKDAPGVRVKHMALFSTPVKQSVSTIRTPSITSPTANQQVFRDLLKLDNTGYFNAYRDPFAKTEYLISDKATGTPITTFSTDKQTPIDLIDQSELPINGEYTVACRHLSDIGEWSAWSKPVDFSLVPIEIFFGFLGALRATGFNDANFSTLAADRVRFGFYGAESSAGFGAALFTSKLED